METNTEPVEPPPGNGQQENTTPLRGGKKPTKTLPSPRLTTPKQLELLRAFAIASEAADGGAVSNETAGDIMSTKMSGSTVIVSNPFLCDVGLLIRKGSLLFEVSETAKAYQKAYEWNADTAGQKLAPAFADKWFAKVLLPRLKMRALAKKEATQVLAEAAGASKDYEANVAMLLEFMDAAGLLKLDGDQVKAGNAGGVTEPVVQQGQADKKESVEAKDPEGDVCWLNRERTRKVIVYAPLDIDNDEVGRLKAWIDLQYFVAETKKPSGEEGAA